MYAPMFTSLKPNSRYLIFNIGAYVNICISSYIEKFLVRAFGHIYCWGGIHTKAATRNIISTFLGAWVF